MQFLVHFAEFLQLGVSRLLCTAAPLRLLPPTVNKVLLPPSANINLQTLNACLHVLPPIGSLQLRGYWALSYQVFRSYQTLLSLVNHF